jgi:hypothetical protein
MTYSKYVRYTYEKLYRNLTTSMIAVATSCLDLFGICYYYYTYNGIQLICIDL